MENNNLDIWENIFKNNEWGKYPPVSLIKFIAKNYYKSPNRKGIKILEIGSGTGANIWYMAREGFTVYGIEGSKTACDNALKRLSVEGLDDLVGEIVVGDYARYLDSFPDGYFDAIIDCESLYCNSFDKSKLVINTAFNKLKSGGRMLSITFADGTFGLHGNEVGYHAVLPINGPMTDKGFTRYTTKEDIERLYKLKNNQITSIERLELHLNNNEIIKEWIIELKKN